MERFDWISITARVLLSFFVVFATYNPSGHSYWHWIILSDASFWSKFTIGAVLFAMHSIALTTAIGALKWRGILLIVVIMFGAWRTLSPQVGFMGSDTPDTAVVLLSGVAFVYAAGLSYSHFHHRLAGVVHVEKVT